MGSIDLIYVLIEEIKKDIKREVKRELRSELKATIKEEIIRELRAESFELDQQYDERFTFNQAALYLNTSRSTLNRILSAGELNCYKIGRRRFFSKNDIDLYIEQKSKVR